MWISYLNLKLKKKKMLRFDSISLDFRFRYLSGNLDELIHNFDVITSCFSFTILVKLLITKELFNIGLF